MQVSYIMRLEKLKKLDRVYLSANVKVLLENFCYLSLLKAASFIFPLVTLPYLSRVIGADMFGVIAFAGAIVLFLETVTDWGFNFTATRDVAKNREDIGFVSKVYSEVLCAKILLMSLCFLALFMGVELIPELKSYKAVLLLTFLYIPGHVFFPEWMFQAFEKMQYITYLNLLSKAIFAGMVFIVIRQQEDYIYQPLLNAGGFIVSGILAQRILIRNFGIRISFPPMKSVMFRIKSSANMFISLILPNFYGSFSTILLGMYCGETATGIYSGGLKIQQISENLTVTLSRTFFPFLARHTDKHHIYVVISGCIAIVSGLLMFFGADLFVCIFLTEEFAGVADIIRIFSITPIFLFLINTYGVNYLVIVGKENILRNIIMAVSLFGFVLTWWLTPRYGHVGAACTVTMVRGVYGMTVLYFAKRIQSRK